MKLKAYLLVDDNRAFADNVAEILRDEGAHVTVATNGVEALAAVKTRKFDALVTDMRMPLMTGAVLVHEIRQVDPGLPAVVISAYTREGDLADARHEGVLAVLPKPVPIVTLLAILRVARRDSLVALIDDDAELCDNLSEALRAKGFTALTARSALEAERLGSLRPFAALVDLRLPGSPHGEVLTALRARFPKLPLVVMTGFPESLPPARAPAGLFAKPFDTDKLLGELDRMHALGAQK